MLRVQAPPGPPTVGPLLQLWRKSRQLSQLALAHEAGISPRHLSFIETGRAKPSRDMVLLLAATLSVPLREQNALLLAAGFAPMFHESALDAPVLGPVRTAIEAILTQQEPYPAVVMNRKWDVLRTNGAAMRFFGMLLDGRTVPGPDNVLRLMFHPDGLRRSVTNWNQVAQSLVQRLHREAVGGVLTEEARQLLAEVVGYPGVPEGLRTADPMAPLTPVLPVCFESGSERFNYFSAVTVLGTPQDITLQEIRIECFFPTDPETAAAARRLAATS